MNYEQLRELIAGREFNLLKRSAETEQRYRRDIKRLEPLSMAEYLKNMLFPSDDKALILRQNDYPYDVANDVIHYVLWANYDIQEYEVGRYLQDVLWFMNPVERRTIPEIWHVHVFIRF